MQSSSNVRLGRQPLTWIRQKNLLSLTEHQMSVNSMSTYMDVRSCTGRTLRVKSRRRHAVFGCLSGNNLRSGGSSQFTSINHAKLQLLSVVLIVVLVHSTVNKPYWLDKKTFGPGGQLQVRRITVERTTKEWCSFRVEVQRKAKRSAFKKQSVTKHRTRPCVQKDLVGYRVTKNEM